jgi:hypothetical protein
VKASPEYKAASNAYAQASARLREFNEKFVPTFKKELAAAREAARAARLKPAVGRDERLGNWFTRTVRKMLGQDGDPDQPRDERGQFSHRVVTANRPNTEETGDFDNELVSEHYSEAGAQKSVGRHVAMSRGRRTASHFKIEEI